MEVVWQRLDYGQGKCGSMPSNMYANNPRTAPLFFPVPSKLNSSMESSCVYGSPTLAIPTVVSPFLETREEESRLMG